ncbi:SMP-30/gluconolactonase/LRE family protein [Kosakonia cowanii]|uniref:SMP-30/gluconolactonase/LRE family protein n=1 Tax=Kosakonia cowanii TaxID=208223 RepID=UPI0009F929DE|nr:SMP-30/gluconolactonase/LRE family protein [Kosakonia cowanii]
MATSRRELLKLSGIATASLLLSQKSFAAWTPAPRYPDPRVVALDDAFRAYMVSSAKVEQIATGCRWAEGPVWFGDMRMLLWSDIPNNSVMRWDEQTGESAVFRKPANNANGHARDRQGRLISCEHDTRRITRTEYDGTITVLADSFDGKPLNSPNDLAVKSDGSIWFTDPPFGITGFYEGHKAEPQLPQNVYRLDPQTRKLEVVLGDVRGPNGICFSPDEKTLYVVESRATPNRLILAWDIVDGQLQNKRVHIDCGNGTADGIACDVDGNLWCGWGMGSDELDGVRVFNPQGKAIGMIHLPERCANLCFGGEQRNRLFMAASTSIYTLYVNTQGAQLL